MRGLLVRVGPLTTASTEMIHAGAKMESAFTGAAIILSVFAARANCRREKHDRVDLFSECVVGASANAFTSALLNPMDQLKTKMQAEILKGDIRAGSVHGSLFRSAHTIYKRDGLFGLWMPGLTATMIRELFNCSLRTGLYGPVRDKFCRDGEDASIWNRISAALITGTMGSIASNPVDVVKVRLLNSQGQGSTFAAYPKLINEEGLSGAFRGVVPSTLRGASLAVGELAAYDQIKTELKSVLEVDVEGPAIHMASSLLTGVIATTMAAPFDVVKTRVMTSTIKLGSAEVLRALLWTEGPRALLRGWLPSYMRLGPHALICLPVMEQMREFVGLGYL